MAAVDPPAGIPLDDRGLLLGDGLFETLLFARGELVLAEAHARRMIDGAAVLGLPAPAIETFIECALAAVRDAGLSQARAAVRVTLTAGSGGRGLDRPSEPVPRLFAAAAPSTRPTTPAVLAVAETLQQPGLARRPAQDPRLPRQRARPPRSDPRRRR